MTTEPTRVAAEYAHLLRCGLVEHFLGMGAYGPGDPEGEEWFAEMQTRATRDGFFTRSYWTPTSPASAFLEPGVMLLRPDGSEYDWRSERGLGWWLNTDEWQTKLLPLLEADWGEKLTDARRRAEEAAAVFDASGDDSHAR